MGHTLTAAQLRELERLEKGPRQTLGCHTAKVQNNLVRQGLAEHVRSHLHDSEDRCLITDAGKNWLLQKKREEGMAEHWLVTHHKYQSEPGPGRSEEHIAFHRRAAALVKQLVIDRDLGVRLLGPAQHQKNCEHDLTRSDTCVKCGWTP
jgi:hypothetical protein